MFRYPPKFHPFSFLPSSLHSLCKIHTFKITAMCKRKFITHYVYIEKFVLQSNTCSRRMQMKRNINVSWYIDCRYVSGRIIRKKILRRQSKDREINWKKKEEKNDIQPYMLKCILYAKKFVVFLFYIIR